MVKLQSKEPDFIKAWNRICDVSRQGGGGRSPGETGASETAAFFERLGFFFFSLIQSFRKSTTAWTSTSSRGGSRTTRT